MSAAVPVRIAVCSYRRPRELARLLPQLLAQAEQAQETGDFAVDIAVVDNDPERSAEPVVRELDDPRVGYLHEPERGISAARNRALDSAAGHRLLAFIDDDEEPREGWLTHLLALWDEQRPAAVAGHVVPEYETEPEPFLTEGGFFVRGTWPTGTRRHAAACNNLLLDLDRVRATGVRFDPGFGLTGGEDTMFTSRLNAAGETLLWSADAVVTDHVPQGRLSRSWVLARAASHGRAGTRVAVALADGTPARAKVRAEKLARGSALMALGGAQWALGRARGDLHGQAWGARRHWRGRGVAGGLRGDRKPAYQRDIVVLQSFPQPRPTTNPYVIQLRDALEELPNVQVRTFSWKTALTGDYDLFHVHWPEILTEGRTPLRAAVRQAMFAALLLRLRLTRRPLVRTKHNIDLPSGLSPVQTALLELAERWTTLYIRLTDHTPVPDGALAATIPHGHYRDWFAQYPAPERTPGRYGYVGQVRGYKGVEQLLERFTELPGDDLSLHVAGRPTSERIEQEVRSRAAGDPRISLRLEHLSDADLVEAVSRSELVVLPYRFMHNSGGALAALSIDRPVLVPDNEVNRDLAAECGPGWVQLYRDELSTDDLRTALEAVHAAGLVGQRPGMSDRDWRPSAQCHVAAYRRALARLGRSAYATDASEDGTGIAALGAGRPDPVGAEAS